MAILLLTSTSYSYSQIADSWAGGNGSKENPYQISDISHLRKLAFDVNRGVSFKGKYLVLTNDIVDNKNVLDENGDLSSSLNGKNQWVAIGTDETISFQGNLDGQGHKIKGIYYDGDIYTGPSDFFSNGFLFKAINEASIVNIVFEDCYLNTIVYKAYGKSAINNCINLGTTQCGFVFQGTKDIIISNCGNWGKFSCYGIGYHVSGTLVNCYNYGSLIKYEHSGAGLVCKVKECINCFNKGDLYGVSGLGGIAWSIYTDYDACAGRNLVNYGLITPFDDKTSGAIISYSQGQSYVVDVYALETSNRNFISSSNPKIELVGDALRMSEDEMKSQEFLDKLNYNVEMINNKGYSPVKCCKWKFGNDGFPILKIVDEDNHSVTANIPLAKNEPVIATEWAGGDGSQENPFQISDISHLRKLAHDVNNGMSFRNKYLILTNDIVDNQNVLIEDGILNEDNADNFNVWTEIGQYKDLPFMGTLDGQGHSISGIYVGGNMDFGTTNGYLFRFLENATIKNIKIKDSYQSAFIYMALGKCLILNCINFGTTHYGIIYSTWKAEGTVVKGCGNYGLSYYTGIGYKIHTVINCYNYGTVRQPINPRYSFADITKGFFSGIVDYAIYCINSVNFGDISGKNIIAGIGACLEANSLASNLVNYGNVSSTDDSGKADLGAIMGGVGDASVAPELRNIYSLHTAGGKLYNLYYSNYKLKVSGDALMMDDNEMRKQDFLDKLNNNARELNNEGIFDCCGWKFGKDGYPILDIIEEGDYDSVETVEMEDNATETIFFNLQGIRVQNPQNGLYIKISNGKREKIFIR